MSNQLAVLGIDLASRSWQDNGSAIVGFSTGEQKTWNSVECGCITWPTEVLSASAMAKTIEQVVESRAIAAVSLDGPQGWREPDATVRKGVGRLCEYESRCQGKTGEYGKTYPQTQHNWIRFCIDVFGELIAGGKAQVANDPQQLTVEKLLDGKFWLLECFPTSTWRSSRLAPLPGKSRVGKKRELVAAYVRSLQQRYRLPNLDPWLGSHDDLQAIVAALPAAGLLGGPCLAIPKGKGSWQVKAKDATPEHWVEGVIWDASLAQDELSSTVELPAIFPKDEGTSDTSNPLLIDDRDDEANSLLIRGIRLFQHLAQLANEGDAVGVGYAQLVCYVHGVESFENVANRPYAQSDTTNVLRLAQQITDENGGAIQIIKDGVAIDAAMDAFVWRKRSPHDRPGRAFDHAAYTEQQWRQVFPDSRRRLLDTAQCASLEQLKKNAESE